MDIAELHDEENLQTQMEDRWERSALPLRYAKNYGSLDGIINSDDPFTIQGVPRFELTEKLNSLLSNALTDDENLLLLQVLGMGCKQRPVKELAKMHGITLQAVQKQLVDIVNKLRHHDDSIQLWKYLNR